VKVEAVIEWIIMMTGIGILFYWKGILVDYNKTT